MPVRQCINQIILSQNTFIAIILGFFLCELSTFSYGEVFYFDPTVRPSLYDESVTIQPIKSPYHVDMMIRKNSQAMVFINDEQYQVNDMVDGNKIIQIKDDCLELEESNGLRRESCSDDHIDNQNLLIIPAQEAP